MENLKSKFPKFARFIDFWIKYDRYKGVACICTIFLNFILLILKLVVCTVSLLICTPHIAANDLLNRKSLSVWQEIAYILLVIVSLILDIPLILLSIIGVYGFVGLVRGVSNDIFMILPAIVFGIIAFFSVKWLLVLFGTLFLKKKPEDICEEIDLEEEFSVNEERKVSHKSMIEDRRKGLLFDETTVDTMSGLEFEQFCANLLCINGYINVRLTSNSGDQGVDILAEKDGRKWAVQCKHYTHSVGNFAVREIYAGMAFYHCNAGVVITNSVFTSKAKECADELGVHLWDRTVLFAMVRDSGMRIEKTVCDVDRNLCFEEETIMTIDEKMIEAVNGIIKNFGRGNKVITLGELRDLLGEKYDVTKGSIIPSDYCYNRVNDGIDPYKKPMLFEFLGQGEYLCLGENYPYNGDIYHKDQIVGVCKNGERKIFKK